MYVYMEEFEGWFICIMYGVDLEGDEISELTYL